MNILFVVNKLIASGAFSQVTAAPTSVGRPPLDAAGELVTLLDSLFPGAIKPLTLKENEIVPSLVYQLTSSGWLRLNGYAVAHTDTYVFYIRTKHHTELTAKVAEVITAIEAGAYAIEVTDMLADYDEEKKQYRVNMEIAFTQPPGDGSLPAAIVYPAGTEAAANEYDSSECSQRRRNNFGVLTLTAGNDLTMLTDAVEASLVGQQQEGAFTPLQLKSGSPLESPGGLQLWSDTYFETQYTTN